MEIKSGKWVAFVYDVSPSQQKILRIIIQNDLLII